MTITGYDFTPMDSFIVVTATSSLGSPTFFWYLDGVYHSRTESETQTFHLSAGELAEVEAVDTETPDAFDVIASAPTEYPARRVLWWIRSTDADVARYVVKQKVGTGAYVEVGEVAASDAWSYRFITPRLTDLAPHTWQVIPVDLAGNEGTPIEVGGEVVVRRPDPSEFTADFKVGTTRVEFVETTDQASPQTILGDTLTAWFDASDGSTITSDVNGISAWANKATGGTPSSVGQTVNANKPTVSAAAVNGLAAVLGFTGGTDSVLFNNTEPPPMTGAPWYAWTVFRKLAADATIGLLFDAHDWSNASLGDGQHAQHSGSSTQTTLQVNEDGVGSGATFSGVAVNVTHLGEFAHEQYGNALQNVDNGTEQATSMVRRPDPALVDSFHLLGAYLNSGASTIYGFNGYICEVAIANGIPSEQQRRDMRAYLGDKWGEAWA